MSHQKVTSKLPTNQQAAARDLPCLGQHAVRVNGIKPTVLIARLIGATTQPGDMIIDPAAVSFNPLKAAHQLGRNFIGCDIVFDGLHGEANERPEAYSERSGKRDLRGAYGLHAREMCAWLMHLQRARALNVVNGKGKFHA